MERAISRDPVDEWRDHKLLDTSWLWQGTNIEYLDVELGDTAESISKYWKVCAPLGLPI